MLELKPCPFCGGEARKYVCDARGDYYAELGTVIMRGREMTHKLIMCKKCGIKTKPYLTDNGAFKAWNRRTTNE